MLSVSFTFCCTDKNYFELNRYFTTVFIYTALIEMNLYLIVPPYHTDANLPHRAKERGQGSKQ